MALKNIGKTGVVLAAVMAALASCSSDPTHPGYEYMPDMYRSPSYETYSENPNFKDSLTARLPVAGTIPVKMNANGTERKEGLNYRPYPYTDTPEGYEAAGAALRNPLDKSAKNVAEGKRLFEINCMHCHGPEGNGDGKLIQNGKFPPPPKYSGQLKDLVEGKMFHSITYGKNLMGAHASLLNQEERWKVVMYVQTLQKGGAAAAPADSAATVPAAGAAVAAKQSK